MNERARALGIGGIFFKSKDPAALRAWYKEHLGFSPDEHGMMFEDGGPVVWSPFKSDTTYFEPSTAPFMINYRVTSLDAIRAQLEAAGVTVDAKVEDMEGVGRFGWAMDPEGNRFELWEPPAKG